MTAEDGIAIATYRITSAYTGYSLYLTVGRKMHTKLCPFTWVSGFPSNIWCLSPVRVHIPNGTAGSLPVLGVQSYGQQTYRDEHHTRKHKNHSTYIHTPVLRPFFRDYLGEPIPASYKKLSYRRGTARCVVSVEILPVPTQQCRNYSYDKS